MRMNYRILSLFAIFLLIPAMGAASEWEVTKSEEWKITQKSWISPVNVSNGSNMVALMQLKNNIGNPIIPEECDSLYTRYRYPRTSSETHSMEYVNGSAGFYYGEVPVGENETLRLEAGGDCEFDGETFARVTGFNTSSNLTTSIINSTDRFLEGNTYNLWLDISDPEDNFESDAEVEWNMYNWNGTEVDFGNTAGEDPEIVESIEHYKAEVRTPVGGNKKYFLVFESEKPNKDFNASFGGDARVITVDKKLKSELDLISLYSRCNDDVSVCEKGAGIQARFRETRSSASEVKGWVSGNGNNLTIDRNELLNFTEVSAGVWKANFTVPPQLDTSKYGKELEVHVVGKSDLSKSKKTRSLSINPFAIKSETLSYTLQGSSIDLHFGPEGPFSGIPLSRSQMKTVFLEIELPNQSTIKVWNNEDVEDIPDENYNPEGLKKYLYTWELPDDAPEAWGENDPRYNFEVRFTDEFGEEKERIFNFEVRPTSKEPTNVVVRDISSSLSDIDSGQNMQKTFKSTGNKSGEILLRNNGTETATVEDIFFYGDLKNITSATDTPFDIPEGEIRSVELNISLRNFTTYDGEIEFDIRGETRPYERTIGVEYNVNNPCEVSTETFCLQNGGITEVYTDEKLKTHEIQIKTLNNNSVSITPSLGENISEIISLSEDSISIDAGKTKTFSFSVAPSIDLNGRHQGNILFGDSDENVAKLPVDFEIDVPKGGLEFLKEGPIDLGELVEGGTETFSVPINNTGNVSLKDITLKSDKLGVDEVLSYSSGEAIVLEPGRNVTANIEINLDSIDTGEYTGDNRAVITATSASGAQGSIEVALKLRRNVEGEVSGLEDDLSQFEEDIDSLEGRASSDRMDIMQGNLESLRTHIDNTKKALEQENYKKASQEFSSAEEVSSKLKNAIGNAKDAVDAEEQSSEDSGGGISIWLIVVPLIVVILVALVIYLSIVPDESLRGGGGDEEPEYGPPM